ncbi:UxaA family hydrolase [Altericroceibacterium xinjiangense]|uniref:UxaA family hydrolase n=1 Tax=Altericroceibacterium xinjiangense TaxID=762261 RepID=UPI000F7E1041|nr:altronate dehydratase family protein [Altericroceibacterium xinjiangense]
MTPVSHNPPALRVHADDNVAIALQDLTEGHSFRIAGIGLTTREPVPTGHKFALEPISVGSPVIKYGQRIGRATAPIAPGEHVHTHNLGTALAGEEEYARPAFTERSRAPGTAEPKWQGYWRADGRAATRNEIWILPSVGCVAPMAEAIAREADSLHKGRVDAVVGFGHPHGCSQLGDDLSGTRALLAGLCDNPNAGGVLLMGLGCESNQLDALLAEVPERSRGKIRTLRAQDAGNEREAALRLIAELAKEFGDAKREPLPVSALTVGLKCGGSDAFSGLTANPLLGRFSDWIAGAGGRLVLTEIPEIFGAEHALLARATSEDVHQRAAALLNRFKRYFLDQGLPVSENPSPGNIAGGITTLEEKSLGAVQKAGNAPLADVIGYGQQASEPGVTLLEAPGNDAVSSTALAAAGATLVLFTTGRGTPLGFPVPTVKIASNSNLAASKRDWIDFDAGRALSESTVGVDEAFRELLMAVAGGQSTAAERLGQRAIAIWKRGVTL